MQNYSRRQLLIAQVEQIAYDHSDRSGIAGMVVFRLEQADGGYHGPEVTVRLVLPIDPDASLQEIEKHFLAASQGVLARLCALPEAEVLARMKDPIGIEAMMRPVGE
jgi:hypothetical protein